MGEGCVWGSKVLMVSSLRRSSLRRGFVESLGWSWDSFECIDEEIVSLAILSDGIGERFERPRFGSIDRALAQQVFEILLRLQSHWLVSERLGLTVFE